MRKRTMFISLLIIAVALVVGFTLIYVQNSRVPKLGVTNGLFQPISSNPNNVSTQTDVAEKKVATWPFKATPEATMAAIKQAVTQYGGAEIKQERPDYLYVVFTTRLMRYHDDAEFWLDVTNKQVHFRSASRAGKSDLGLNRKRYNALTEFYNAQGQL